MAGSIQRELGGSAQLSYQFIYAYQIFAASAHPETVFSPSTRYNQRVRELQPLSGVVHGSPLSYWFISRLLSSYAGPRWTLRFSSSVNFSLFGLLCTGMGFLPGTPDTFGILSSLAAMVDSARRIDISGQPEQSYFAGKHWSFHQLPFPCLFNCFPPFVREGYHASRGRPFRKVSLFFYRTLLPKGISEFMACTP